MGAAGAAKVGRASRRDHLAAGGMGFVGRGLFGRYASTEDACLLGAGCGPRLLVACRIAAFLGP